jgi:hypothetical protein
MRKSEGADFVGTLKANTFGIRFDFMRWLSAQAKNNYL